MEERQERWFSLDFETEVPPEDGDYTLEEILSEYGGGLEQQLSGGPSLEEYTPEAGADGAHPIKKRAKPWLSWEKLSDLGGLLTWIRGGKRVEAAESVVEKPAESEPAVEEAAEAETVVEEPVVEAPTVEELPEAEPAEEEPTDEEPVDEEPTDEEPADEKPTDEEPAEEEPPEEEPTEEEPSDEEPTDEEPVDEESPEEEPADEEPADEKPVDEEPAEEEPTDEEPADEEPADKKPADEKPVEEEPTDEEPADEEPADEEPADEEPADKKPADEEPADEESTEEEPADEEPADEESTEEEPADEEPADEEPVEEEPSEEEPVDEEPADEEPVEEEPSDEEPVEEEPTDEEPAEEPTDEEPVDEEPTEEESPEEEPTDEEPTDEESSDKQPPAEEPVDEEAVEELVGSTVDAVMTEREARMEALRQKRDALLAKVRQKKPPLRIPRPYGPEISLKDAAARYREAYTRRQVPPLALATALLPILLLALESRGTVVPLWSVSVTGRTVVLLACLIATGGLCRQVFTGSAGAFLCGVSAVAAVCDCVARLVSSGRSVADTYGAVACLALLAAQWGVSLDSRGRFDTFRAAAVDEQPPYMVADTPRGACKQRGSSPGFYTSAVGMDLSSAWQTLFAPLALAVSVVFAFLSSVGQGRTGDFFLNWSIILAAGATFTLPLCWALPWARLARRLQKAGAAVAGWAGAEKLSRRRTMILTDTDLFPPGSVQLNGIKLYSDEMEKAVSYAAAMTRAAACGLERVFDDLLRSEVGYRVEAEEFSFYEEGGFAAVIQDQPVLMGTASFLRRMGVLLPRDLRLSAGMFLAVDRRLIAVFAIRYHASDNVDYALRMMRKARIAPVLASRDPNLTPALLRRKFRRDLKAEYPDLAERVALSEAVFNHDFPRALLFREGLLPYAEAVVGSRRLCRGVRRATLLSAFGSAAGMLLCFYLVFQSKYELLTPLTLTGFLLLWLFPALLVMELF